MNDLNTDDMEKAVLIIKGTAKKYGNLVNKNLNFYLIE